MNPLIIVMLVFAVLISGCVGTQPEKPVTPTPAINATEEPFSHDLDTALEELDQIG